MAKTLIENIEDRVVELLLSIGFSLDEITEFAGNKEAIEEIKYLYDIR